MVNTIKISAIAQGLYGARCNGRDVRISNRGGRGRWWMYEIAEGAAIPGRELDVTHILHKGPELRAAISDFTA
jgi:hypothetical protein